MLVPEAEQDRPAMITLAGVGRSTLLDHGYRDGASVGAPWVLGCVQLLDRG